MYSQNPLKDGFRFVKAFLSNQLARFAPATYLKLTHQTGRGDAPESSRDIVQYFHNCLKDYCERLGVEHASIRDYLKGKCVLEYGPGDIPGVALLMYAYGAAHVSCIDRFPIVSFSEKNVEALEALLHSLPEKVRKRAETAFNRKGEPASGFNAEYIRFLVKADGLSGAAEKFDLILSRAVLEHVSNLEETFVDMKQALKAGGICIHQVDLRGHGLERETPLDFLLWPPVLWSLMHSQKGYPNRWRIDTYRKLSRQAGLNILTMTSVVLAEPKDLRIVRPYLAAPFREISDEDLACLVFWLVLQKDTGNAEMNMP